MPQGTLDLSTHGSVPILFSQFRGPFAFNMAGEGGGGDPPAGDPPADPAGKGDPPPPAPSKDKKDDTEGRITQLANENKELKRQLKEKADADKAAEEAKLLEEGKIKDLLATREKELSDLKGLSESTQQRIEAFETAAKAQIEAGLASIQDEDRRKSAQAMLEGQPVEKQFQLLPEVLKLAGVSQGGGFGGPTPAGDNDAAKQTKAQKQARFQELLAKEQEEGITPQERSEKYRLMNELSPSK